MSESYVTNNVKTTNFKSDNNDYLRVRLFARVNCFARVPAVNIPYYYYGGRYIKKRIKVELLVKNVYILVKNSANDFSIFC